MKKIIIAVFIAAFLFIAFRTKPDDKTCILKGVRAVWGTRVPPEDTPMYFEPFMNLTSKSVKINDWIFLKQIKYKFTTGYKTIGFGAFNTVFTSRLNMSTVK
ncbi:MAG: hypothetical protein ABIR81_02405 [Ginsengibacter sp.]